MNRQLKFFVTILFSAFLLCCSNENKNSNKVTENDETGINNLQGATKF